jgi:hypothetical protein
MGDQSTERAAQEYLAVKLSQEQQQIEDRLNREAARSLALVVWKRLAKTVFAKCAEWNAVTKEETLTCKETALGDLRIRCAGRTHHMTVHFDSRKLQVIIRNSARPENEPDTVLSITGYPTESGRDARLVRNNEPINMDMLVIGHLRVLSGLSRDENA